MFRTIVAVSVVLALESTVLCDEPQPTPQLVIPCEIVEVYDGDTLTVRLSLDVRVRMLDCWSAEVRSRDLREKQLGLEARDFLRTRAEPGSRGFLTVPLLGVDRLDDLFTFGRLLGHVHIKGNRQSLAEQLRECGHAYKTKAELKAILENEPVPDPTN